MSNLVFVYGTLKRGFGNHRLLEKAKYLGDYKTIDKYTMLSLGAFPAVVLEQETSRISGEIFLINKTILQNLDFLEGYPEFYNRLLLPTPDTIKHINSTMWMYYIQGDPRTVYYQDKYPIISDGIWRR